LAIGCTFGEEEHRLRYLSVLQSFTELADLDLPPFLFRLGEKPEMHESVKQLLDELPLMALGFRSVLINIDN
jgi:hypothetical protein